jgi:amidase
VRAELVVARIRAAGAIVFGKTNVPEFAMGAHTDDTLFADPQPLQPGPVCGRVLRRSAATPATGIAAVCEGSDLGGALRNPGSFGTGLADG